MSEKTTDMKNNSTEREVRFLSTGKAILLGLPNLGLTATMGVAVSLGLIFYINIMGQPALIVGGIFSAALYVYAIMCILGGALSDKIGKKKIMWISGPFIALSFFFLWYPPIPTTDYGYGYLPLIAWLLCWNFIFRVCIGLFQPSMYAFLPELSTDEQNRVKASMINMLCILGGTVIGAFIPIILMGDSTKNLSRENRQLYYPVSEIGRAIATQIQMLSTFISILFVVLFIVMLIIIKEPEKDRSKKTSIKAILTQLGEPLKDKNYRLFLITFFLFWIPFIAFQYLVVNLGTFLLRLQGVEFIILAVVALICAILSFGAWKTYSEKKGIKQTLTTCLIFATIAFTLILILLIPMPHALLFGVGLLLITLCLCSLVGSMVFPFAIISDIIDQAERATKKNLSGSYSGAFTMAGSLAAGTAMLMISIFLEVFGPESPFAYAFILALGAMFIFISVFLFQKVKIVGTSKSTKK